MTLANILFKTIVTTISAIILLRLIIDEYKNSYRLPIFNVMSIVYIIIKYLAIRSIEKVDAM
ncbi:hypothetical protein ACFVT8_05635 [Lysinibacillus sp. NPDC058147]|uniref:hypothetical protein n=1 Tax=unclassified Lysinibacillus TaxID=2636778 RepID=UPI0036DA6444